MTQRERDEYLATLACEGLPLDVIRTTLRGAKTLARFAEKSCNVGLSERETHRKAKLSIALVALLAPYRITPIFQDDPRGAVMKLRVPSGRTNDWDRQGICVPV